MHQIAIVTGASHPNDIGSAICRKLAEQKLDIFFTHWKAAAGYPELLSEELAEKGIRCGSLEVDLSQAGAAELVLEETERQLGVPSVLVNNAAHSVNEGFELLDTVSLDMHYAVNMRSTFMLAVLYARKFKEMQPSAYGSIVNMTSGQELGPMPEELAYSATKGAIAAFTRSLSSELGSYGITVNAVNPGPTDSTWMTSEIKQHLQPKFALGRIGLPEDAARAVAFLVSEEARWITGQIINSEGGYQRS